QKKASARRTYTDNEKYTFRCWMLRLGLNGEEFKTCRHHLLANLTGNSAWRKAA
ncbi:MAG: amidoligase, partial [Niameybacter sp.]